MKRTIAVILTALLLLVPMAANAALDYNSIPTPQIIVVDGDDVNAVFFERAADERAYPASTTKIMTCMLALEAGNLDDSVTVGEEVTPFTNYSSLMGLKSGDTVTMRDLVYGLMLVSGNDAAAAIAVHVGGSIESFVAMMNAKASQLGMNGTHFTNPHGVQSDEHYTTARDMAKLMAYALQNPEFCEIDKTISYTVPSSGAVLMTTNRLLRNVEGDPMETYYEYAVGGKTGDTDTAGKCLVAVAERDGARVIVVLFGDKQEMYGDDKVYNNLARFINARSIFEHVFETEYSAVTAEALNVQTDFFTDMTGGDPAALVDGVKLEMQADVANLVCRLRTTEATSLKVNAAAITTEVELSGVPIAPIAAGQAMGSVRYLYQGRTLFTAPLTALHDVGKDPNAPQFGDGTDDDPFAATATPLIDKGHKKWSTGDVMLLVFVLLIVLLVALIVVFVITERKRRYERRRRSAAKRRKRRY